MKQTINTCDWTGEKAIYRLCGIVTFCFFVLCLCPAAVAAGEAGDGATFSVRGFLESENWISTDPDLAFSDAVKKTELRNRLELKYGVDRFYLYLTSDLYYHPDLVNKGDGAEFDYRYANSTKTARNLRLSGDRCDWTFNNFFLNYLIYPLRLRLGNQIFRWGTADVFNPTAYFNPYDFREFLLRDTDEFRQGVPSMSAMYFGDNITAELAVSLIHVPMQFAAHGNFWTVDRSYPLYNLSVQESDGMDVAFENMGVGARVTTNLLGTDISFSVYHGPDREPVQRPDSITYVEDAPLTLNVVQYYDIVNMIGLDLSKTIGDFVFQVEGAYSPDKPNFVTKNLSDPSVIELPLEVRRSSFISYAAGFNYFVPINRLFEDHTGEMVFTLDWFQSVYFDSDLAKPFISDILTLRLQDSYLEGQINVKITTMFETRYGGSIYWPTITYDFQNGWTTELAYTAIDGRLAGETPEPLFYHFRNNDFVSLRVRYEF